MSVFSTMWKKLWKTCIIKITDGDIHRRLHYLRWMPLLNPSKRSTGHPCRKGSCTPDLDGIPVL